MKKVVKYAKKEEVSSTTKKLLRWYAKNVDELVETYRGRFLVIADKRVAFVCDDREKGYQRAIREIGAGRFIIQYCSERVSEWSGSEL
jgi:hypothetical protein